MVKYELWGGALLLASSLVACHAPAPAEPPAVDMPMRAMVEHEPGAASTTIAVQAPRDPSRALDMMPSGVEWVMSMDMSQVAERPRFRERLLESMSRGRDWSETLAAFEACGHGPRQLGRVSAGGWFDRAGASQHSEYVVVFEGEALVSPERLACLSEEWARREGKALVFEDRGPFVRIRAADQSEQAPWVYAVGEGRLLVAEGVTPGAIESVLRGHAPNARQGPLVSALAYADLDATMFWLGHIEGLMSRANSTQNPLVDAKSASLGIRLAPGGGLDVHARAEMPSESLARSTSDFLLQEFEQLKPMASMFGMSRESVEGVEFGSLGAMATLFVPLNASEVDSVFRNIEAPVVVSHPKSNESP